MNSMESPLLLWRQFQISLGLLLVAVPAYLLNAFLLALYFQGVLGASLVWPWAGTCGLVGLGWLGFAWAFRRPVRGAGFPVTLGLAAFALVMALLFSWFGYQAFPAAPHYGQVILAGFFAALVCVGSVALATIPLAAGAWIVGLYLGIFGTLAAPGTFVSAPLWTMLLSGAAALSILVAGVHRHFLARLKAEFHASHQSQIVGLLLNDFEEGSQDWLWETDAEGRLRSVSPRLAAMLGRPAPELEGRSFVDLLLEETPGSVEDEDEAHQLRRRLADDKPFRDLEFSVSPRGRISRWRLTAKPIVDSEGRPDGWRGVGSDVTEMQRLNTLNARLALLDSLTGLANRYRLMTVLHDALSPREGDRPCALVLLDLEGFRIVNEGLGHEAGDNLLREVAQRLRGKVPAPHLLARLAGDEFAVLAPGLDAEGVEALISDLRSTAEDPYLVDGHRIEASYQIGRAHYPDDAPSATELLKNATLALREAKLRADGLPVAYRPELGQRAKDKVRLQGELRLALIQNEFELHYQPQLAAGGPLVGAEALVRWRHPVRGLVSPAEFIPVLEETGLIVPVGLWILEAACREALTWPEGQKVAVNVSAVQFASRTFLDSVRGVLAATGLPPGRLELEITESVMAQDPKQVVQILTELRSLGVSISLDDFGTGYSSLSYLRQLPLDRLKVDQSFVRVLGQDRNAEAIVRTVLELSKTLGLATTAEGVETEDQKALLIRLGVDHLQGYLFSRPLPAAQLREFRSRG